jgi:hypothetical protein
MRAAFLSVATAEPGGNDEDRRDDCRGNRRGGLWGG